MRPKKFREKRHFWSVQELARFLTTTEKPIFIIEHLEPKLEKWCLLEYAHVSELLNSDDSQKSTRKNRISGASKIMGKSNLWFTNVKKSQDRAKLIKFGNVFSKSVASINLPNACVLDPEARKTLSPEDKSKFFIFGGILGNYPPDKRTGENLTRKIKYKIEARNLGKEQMSTDNAVYAAKQILKGKNFSELKFKDTVEIPINKILTIQLPYRYNFVKGKPFISRKLAGHIKKTEAK